LEGFWLVRETLKVTSLVGMRVVVFFALIVLCFAQPPGAGPGAGPGTGSTTGSNGCSEDGSDYEYSESVSGTMRAISNNGCPNHPVKNHNPNYPVPGTNSANIPAYPQLETVASAANLATRGGTIGLFFDGALLFSPFAGTGTGENWSTSAVYLEADTFDMCGGHGASALASSYHYHLAPPCLLSQLGDSGSVHSPQIGWAYDGFPVYGPYGPNGVAMQSCSVNGNVAPCTDSCGGYEASIDEDSFLYRYYTQGPVQDGDSCDTPMANTTPAPSEAYHPHTPLCFRGCCPSGESCSNLIKSCSNSATDGYESAYEPEVLYPTGLDLNCEACWASGQSGEIPDACSATTTAQETTTTTTTTDPSSTVDPNAIETTDPESGTNGLFAAVAVMLSFLSLL